MEESPKNIVIIGDGYVGKTSILTAIKENKFKDQVPNIFSEFEFFVTVNGRHSRLRFLDTAGQEEYSMLRKLSYKDANIFLLCFAVDDAVSFENCETKWIPDIQEYGRIPIILVGTKSDLRDGHNPCIPKEEIARFQKKIGALHYIESSAKTQEGIVELMQKTTKILVSSKERSCILQ